VKKAHWLFLWPAGMIIILDQVLKIWVTRVITRHETVPLISGLVDLVQVRNRGMAFGMLNRTGADWQSYLLIGATLAAIAIIAFWFKRIEEGAYGAVIGLSLVLGGAIGNLIDRIRLREVIDFLDFHVGDYHWPAFNLADSAITIGTLWLAVYLLFFSHAQTKKRKSSGGNRV
jgi:signal peptidase II